MTQDTPEIDVTARRLAESVYVAFAQQATMPAHPLAEQTVVTRLVEAIRGRLPGGSGDEIAAAINGALDAWEAREPEVRGPRVAAVDLAAGTATLRPA
ncbi:hypothetical protein Q8W71_22115 [Methylobacterium sp. NEAU 140]|uniref:hypothetical protein n=1 Tax=Methylobacterium sp. NEAU 140 TaxID=3064945 RepID=UPI0027334C38|nr:hypothetical protein [Methylobacterium sp. NEAU 140]MDP4025330.1 hypothetical protein [Methylobacterium sp. NEAU 140]